MASAARNEPTSIARIATVDGLAMTSFACREADRPDVAVWLRGRTPADEGGFVEFAWRTELDWVGDAQDAAGPIEAFPFATPGDRALHVASRQDAVQTMADVSQPTGDRARRSWPLVVLVNIGVTACLLALMEFAAYAFMESLPVLSGLMRDRSFTRTDPRVQSGAYTDRDYARRVFADFARLDEAYAPYVVWKNAPLASETLNIDDNGLRRTCFNQAGGTRVFMFGGSTLFGTGVDDCGTIASLVARELNEQVGGVEVFNFGTSGYQSTQELIQLVTELQRGNVPAVAIFYDGVNDTYAGAYSPGIPGAHQNLDLIAGRFSQGHLARAVFGSQTYRALLYLTERLGTRQQVLDAAELDADVRGTVATYLRNMEAARSLAGSFGFRTLAFWQPVLLASGKPRTDEEQGIVENSGSMVQAYTAVYAAMRREALDTHGVVDISAALDGTPEQLYIDFSHLGPRGNELVAAAMVSAVVRAGVLPRRR